MKTEVLSIRVRKELKEEADNLGIDVKKVLESILEEMIAARKQRSNRIAKELSQLMNVTTKEWVNGVRNSRKER